MEQRHVSPPRKGVQQQQPAAAAAHSNAHHPLHAFQQPTTHTINFADSLNTPATVASQPMAQSTTNQFLMSLQQLSNFGQAAAAGGNGGSLAEQQAYSHIMQHANTQWPNAFTQGSLPMNAYNAPNMAAASGMNSFAAHKNLNPNNGFAAFDLLNSAAGVNGSAAGLQSPQHSQQQQQLLQQQQHMQRQQHTAAFNYGAAAAGAVPSTSSIRTSVNNMLGGLSGQPSAFGAGHHNQHAVDQLEEALSTLSRDYNLNDELGELTGNDLNEHLLRDAFFGSAALQQQQPAVQAQVQHSQQHTAAQHSLLAQHAGRAVDPSTAAAASSVVSAVVDSLHHEMSALNSLQAGGSSVASANHVHASLAGSSLAPPAINAQQPHVDMLHSIFDFDPSSLTVKDAGAADKYDDKSGELGLNEVGTGSAEEADTSAGILFESAVAPAVVDSKPDDSAPSVSVDAQQVTDPAAASKAPAALAGEAPVPKVREKIRAKRDKELAEIDRAFDRHLSLVAEKNARAARTLTELDLPALPSLPKPSPPQASETSNDGVRSPAINTSYRFGQAATSFEHQHSPQPGTSKSGLSPSTNAGASPSRFSPCRFSPEREEESTSTAAAIPAMIFGLPETTPAKEDKAPLPVLIPKDQKQVSPKKIPIYRLMKSPPPVKEELDVVNDVPPPPHAEDAFEFDDFEDEQDELLGAADKSISENETSRTSDGIKSTTPRRTRNSSYYDRDSTSADPEGDLWRHVVPKKRHNVASSEKLQSKPAAPLLPPDAAVTNAPLPSPPPPPPREKTQAEILADKLNHQLDQKLEWKRDHSFVVSEVKSSRVDRRTAGCTLKGEGTRGSGRGRGRGRGRGGYTIADAIVPVVPKVIIRMPKLIIKREPEEPDANGQSADEDSGRKKKKKHKKHKKHRRKRRDGSVGSASGDERALTNGHDEPAAEPTAAAPHFSKKRRIMDEWARDEQQQQQVDQQQTTAADTNGRSASPPSLFEQLAAKFGPATTAASTSSAAAVAGNCEIIQPKEEPAPASSNGGGTEPQQQTVVYETIKSEALAPTPSVSGSIVSSQAASPSAASSPGGSRRHKKKRHRHREPEQPKYEVFIADDPASTYEKLTHFRMSLRTLQKGQYVAHKADLHLPDCPLWKVDNQNLLQKFPSENLNGRLVYRNSSTYAGWCPQSASKYVVVTIRFVKHSRSEVVVEPETPLADLLPAVIGTADCNEEQQGSSTDMPVINVDSDDDDCAVDSGIEPDASKQRCASPGSDMTVVDQPLRDALEMYLQALLMHVITGNALATIKQNNEWKFLRHINDVDQLNQQKIGRLLTDCRWSSEYRDAIQSYINLVSEPLTEPVDDAECQACTSRPASSRVLAFGEFFYDEQTLELRPVSHDRPALDFVVCSECARLAQLYHRLCHVRYRMFAACELQVERVRNEQHCMPPNQLIDECLRHRDWMKTVVLNTLKVWRDVTEEVTVDGV